MLAIALHDEAAPRHDRPKARGEISQSIEVGPVKVDTGNDWLDFTFAIVLLAAFVAGTVIVKRTR